MAHRIDDAADLAQGHAVHCFLRGPGLIPSVRGPSLPSGYHNTQFWRPAPLDPRTHPSLFRLSALSHGEFHAPDGSSPARGIAIGKTTVDLLQPFCRLLDLLDASEDIPFLSNLIQREIVYRLLRGPQGERLRAIATLGDQSHRTAKAIAWLRANYTKPLRVEKLAEIARMGMSTLHHHFRSLTAMSQLQYQKQLRLVAARERMLVEGIDAASAAFEVGYESASQFNREYKRFFGQPPMRDIKVRRLAGSAMVSD